MKQQSVTFPLCPLSLKMWKEEKERDGERWRSNAIQDPHDRINSSNSNGTDVMKASYTFVSSQLTQLLVVS